MRLPTTIYLPVLTLSLTVISCASKKQTPTLSEADRACRYELDEYCVRGDDKVNRKNYEDALALFLEAKQMNCNGYQAEYIDTRIQFISNNITNTKESELNKLLEAADLRFNQKNYKASKELYEKYLKIAPASPKTHLANERIATILRLLKIPGTYHRCVTTAANTLVIPFDTFELTSSETVVFQKLWGGDGPPLKRADGTYVALDAHGIWTIKSDTLKIQFSEYRPTWHLFTFHGDSLVSIVENQLHQNAYTPVKN